MRSKWHWAILLLVFVGGCRQYLGVGAGKPRECPMFEDVCTCGDGEVSANIGEVCDDGNTTDGDGCSSKCKHEVVASIVAGAFHTCVLLSSGAVKCWGFGGLGLGDRKNRGDEPDEMGSRLPVVALGKDKHATALVAGAFHTCAMLVDGSVKCWGLNGIGQLGLGDTRSRGDDPDEMGDDLPVVDLGEGMMTTYLAAGTYHTCAWLNDSIVKCWGANASGQLGLGDTDARGNSYNQMGENLAGFTSLGVIAGGYVSCTRSDMEVKCWGENALGQLGQGHTSDVGDEQNEMGGSVPAIQLGNDFSVQSLAVGHAHVCALSADGRVKCWGGNGRGQLGQGHVRSVGTKANEMGDDLPSVDLGTSQVLQIIAGQGHTCVLLTDGTVKCWGGNEMGQLGVGDTENRGDEPGEMGDALPSVALGQKAKMVAAGQTHTCALLEDGAMKCWGGNEFGQLGVGDTQNRGDGVNDIGSVVNVFYDE